MADELGDKTEAPTPHRRAEARREGNVPRSADLAAALLCLATLLLLRQCGGGVVAALKLVAVESFGGAAPSAARIGYLLGTSLMPLLVGLTLIAVAAHVLQTGPLFGFRKNTAFDFAAGFGRMFDGRTAAQIGFSVLKLAVVTVVIVVAARGRLGELLAMASGPSADLLHAAGKLAFAVGIRVSIALVVLGVIDYAYQRLRHERELRMTRQEVKDELRRNEGDAATKRRRRELARTWHQSPERSRA